MRPSNRGTTADVSTVRVLIAVMGRAERQGVKLLLGAQPDIEVVAETGERGRAVALAAVRRPHVMVVDLPLPGLECLQFLHEVRSKSPKTRVVILNMPQGVANIHEDSVAYDLIQAVRNGANHRNLLQVPLPLAVIDPQWPNTKGPSRDLFEKLTPREQEVVLMATKGFSSTETARQLRISPRTVEAHRAHAMRKLGLHRRADLVRYVLVRDVLRPEPGGSADS